MEGILDYLPPLNILALYVVFSLLVFSVQTSIKRFNGTSELAHWWLLLTGSGGLCFKYGYLIYYGYTTSWQHAVTFYVVGGLLLLYPGTTVLAFLTARSWNSIFVFGYSGAITLPLLGYFMIISIPD